MLTFAHLLTTLVPRFVYLVTFRAIELRSIFVYAFIEFFYSLILFLKKNSLFRVDQLVDICVIDRPFISKRFELCYIFANLRFPFRLFVNTFLKDGASIASLSSLYKSSMWLERECWDMFGIFFSEHPDLRRILTDYGFDGFPLRKDFPLSGYTELRYDDEFMHIVYEPVEFSQNFRFFTFLSPWEASQLV